MQAPKAKGMSSIDPEEDIVIDGSYSEQVASSEMESKSIADIFEQISDWKLEAKLEDNARYFYHVNEVGLIEKGRRSFVIGRKGCGKTAISEYLCRTGQTDAFSVKLTFKNFPFNELYNERDTGYAGPHQYITLWKFLIYSHVCELMAENSAIDADVREKLISVYVTNKAPTFQRRVNAWLSRDFGKEIFEDEKKSPRSVNPQRERSLVDRVNTLEDIILKSIDAKKYLIVFDELDEDYRNIIDKKQNEQYSSLITGLFKAVQDVRSVFSKNNYHLYPIVFLRDDIYELIQDSDKTKWSDLKISLDWDIERIKSLLAFRISRSIDPKGAPMSFDKAWHCIFARASVKIGNNGKTVPTFDYILRSTQLRPRDFIQYLKSCTDDHLTKASSHFIGARTIKKVDNAFSNYLKSELTDEIHAVLPDITTIFDVISQLRKWSFSITEFISGYNRQLKRTQMREKDPTFVLQVLFLFSVIGNHPRPDRQIFRYKNKEARFNFDEQVVVHRGLFKSLQIDVN